MYFEVLGTSMLLKCLFGCLKSQLKKTSTISLGIGIKWFPIATVASQLVLCTMNWVLEREVASMLGLALGALGSFWKDWMPLLQSQFIIFHI